MAHDEAPKKHDEVPLKIDKTPLKTPSSTTGAALYLLGKVGAGYDLWLEVPGPSEDLFVANDASPLEVKPGSQFYTAKKTLNPGNG